MSDQREAEGSSEGAGEGDAGEGCAAEGVGVGEAVGGGLCVSLCQMGVAILL